MLNESEGSEGILNDDEESINDIIDNGLVFRKGNVPNETPY